LRSPSRTYSAASLVVKKSILHLYAYSCFYSII
jgi:hypothetical protein